MYLFFYLKNWFLAGKVFFRDQDFTQGVLRQRTLKKKKDRRIVTGLF